MLFLHERQCSSLFKFGISEKENFDFLIDRFSFCTIQCTWLTMIALYCRIILQGQEKMCNSISERERERESGRKRRRQWKKIEVKAERRKYEKKIIICLSMMICTMVVASSIEQKTFCAAVLFSYFFLRSIFSLFVKENLWHRSIID